MSVRKKPLPKNDLWGLKQDFILASGSSERRKILEDAGFVPNLTVSTDIDEMPLPGELPARYVKRMAIEKAISVSKKYPNACILAADNVCAVGKRLIRKAHNEEEARKNLKLLSGRRHRVMTGFCVLTPEGHKIAKVVQTTVIIKHMDDSDIRAILQSEEWKDVAGYRIEGVLSACVSKIIGSYPNVVGLPIFEVAQVLKGILRHK